jgi:RimJ/RimL family protein N-acetyltransferase
MTTSLKNVRLETERLLLREHVFEDWRAMEEYTPREDFWRYLQVGRLEPGSARKYLHKLLLHSEQLPRLEYNLAVLEKADGTLVGSVRLGEIDHDNANALLGFALSPDHWGRGYATEGVERLVRFGFEDLELHRIHAICDVENHASYRVMEKLGFRREGLLRENKLHEHRPGQRQWRSSYVYAVLAGG